MTFQAPRGTLDILPEDQKYWRYVEHHASKIAARFGFQRIDTPVFENAELFERSVGDSTDIVEKETYTFTDRGGDRVTLRPEGTAPVCRAYIQHGMHTLASTREIILHLDRIPIRASTGWPLSPVQPVRHRDHRRAGRHRGCRGHRSRVAIPWRM